MTRAPCNILISDVDPARGRSERFAGDGQPEIRQVLCPALACVMDNCRDREPARQCRQPALFPAEVLRGTASRLALLFEACWSLLSLQRIKIRQYDKSFMKLRGCLPLPDYWPIGVISTMIPLATACSTSDSFGTPSLSSLMLWYAASCG